MEDLSGLFLLASELKAKQGIRPVGLEIRQFVQPESIRVEESIAQPGADLFGHVKDQGSGGGTVVSEISVGRLEKGFSVHKRNGGIGMDFGLLVPQSKMYPRVGSGPPIGGYGFIAVRRRGMIVQPKRRPGGRRGLGPDLSPEEKDEGG